MNIKSVVYSMLILLGFILLVHIIYELRIDEPKFKIIQGIVEIGK